MTVLTQETITIAVAGHTNTGKTTLLRTLMRYPAGEVKDSANVTLVGTVYHYDGLQANFRDAPGFQHASAVSMYLDAKEEDPNYKVPTKWADKLNIDMEAIKSLENSHVVLYVGSLSVVPDDSYREEIEIVKRIQPRVIGILNQKRKQIEASSEEITENCIAQWKKVFQEQGIESVVVFDAHWDKPNKVNEIYDCVDRIIDPNCRSIFQNGLKEFEKRQQAIRQEACNMISECVQICRQKAEIYLKKSEYSELNIQQAIQSELNNTISEFRAAVTELYKIAAEHPTESKEQLEIRLNESVNWDARVGISGAISSVFGGGGAAIGAVIGGFFAAVFTGGLGAAGGAALGAQIGGALGAATGGLALLSDEDDNVEIDLSSKAIRNIVAANLATVWGVSNLGFGSGRELSQEEIEEIKNQILESKLLPSNIDWTTVESRKIISYCEATLDWLESES